jgi:hypothetical protein
MPAGRDQAQCDTAFLDLCLGKIKSETFGIEH